MFNLAPDLDLTEEIKIRSKSKSKSRESVFKGSHSRITHHASRITFPLTLTKPPPDPLALESFAGLLPPARA
jgi:hypothetical protein